MDLSQFGNLGELIGGVAVVGSLIFVGMQIRQNTRALKLAHYRAVHDGIRDSQRVITSDAELAAISLRGFHDLASLDPVARYRFDIALFSYLGQFELAWEANLDGLYPSDKLVPFRTTVAAWLSTPGGAAWWQERRVWFSTVTRNAIDAALADESLDLRHAGPPCGHLADQATGKTIE